MYLSIHYLFLLFLYFSLSNIFWVSVTGKPFTKNQSQAVFSWPQGKSYLAVWGKVGGGRGEHGYSFDPVGTSAPSPSNICPSESSGNMDMGSKALVSELPIL